MKSVVLGKGGTLKGGLEAHRASLAARLAAGDDGVALGRANAGFLDEQLRAAFHEAVRAARLPAEGLALAACGSFGRGAVAVRSDADVMLLVDPRAVSLAQAGELA